MRIDRKFWAGKSVFLTGHTGFKGGWLSLWLKQLGAKVTGYSLEPPTTPSFHESNRLSEVVDADLRGDIRDESAVTKALRHSAADIVFHLAAQPLVRFSYAEPIETYDVNVLGTAKVLEAVRKADTVRAVVVVTTDKCYENREWVWPYRETDPMGGYDPYSSSKGCAELVTAAYRRAFLAENGVQLASARAGNVIGGGDWASDRLIPDFLRMLASGETLVIRSPNATRPWQHVLEPLSGYLELARRLYESGDGQYAEGWNFGPVESDLKSVRWIVESLAKLVPEMNWEVDKNPQLHEATALMLSSAKAKHLLGWQPRWRLATALEKTIEWHRGYVGNEDMRAMSVRQIEAYEQTEPHD
jgi:CDP-glucose 4,6-dehydratase